MKRRMWTAILCSLGMIILIVDAETALNGASEGIDLCLRSVIPSLLPFFVLSMLLTNALSGMELKLLRPIGRLCGIPEGGEGLLAVGLLGGYPVGAQCIAQAYENRQLSRKTAQRLLGFCSNAGPAFVFGIVARKFTQGWAGWALWGIQILSALTVGVVLPGIKQKKMEMDPKKLKLTDALSRCIKVMGTVC